MAMSSADISLTPTTSLWSPQISVTGVSCGCVCVCAQSSVRVCVCDWMCVCVCVCVCVRCVCDWRCVYVCLCLSTPAGSRFKYTYYNKEDGPIHKSIENLDRCVSVVRNRNQMTPNHFNFTCLLQGMAKIETMDPRAFSTYLQETHNTICGRHPIAVLLNVRVT